VLIADDDDHKVIIVGRCLVIATPVGNFRYNIGLGSDFDSSHAPGKAWQLLEVMIIK